MRLATIRRLGSGLFAGLSILLAMSADAAEAVRFEAEVRRTEYGIPHVKASDWGGLGYGYGYAYAEDNFCVAMRAIVAATGRSAEFFGEDEGDPIADFVLRYTLGTEAEFRQHLPAAETPSARLVEGFAAGMNRYLRETGSANLPEGEDGCRSADWVAPIEPVQLWMSMARLALQASSDQEIVRNAIYTASTPVTAPQGEAAAGGGWATLEADLRRFGQALANAERGSNAIAVGRDLSRSGHGLLLGNPHQPWRGSSSFYQVQLTIPGVYDVAGASLQGMPVVGIGFNRNIAWTHTVSFATRFTLYQLQMHPNRRQYRYGGGYRDLVSKTVEIRVKGKDGALRTQRQTFRRSHFGPLVNLRVVSPALGNFTYSLRDANVGRYKEMLAQYLRMGQASDMAAFTESLRGIGIPVFHTLAADRDGEAFYGEVASVPHVTQAQLTRCVSLFNFYLRLQTNNAAIALDGSNPYCEWGSSPDSPPDSGLYGYDARPKRQTTTYVANSNDSYWLSNPENPLTGYPVVFDFLGHEGQQQLLRTRIGHLMLGESSRESRGSGLDLAALKTLLYRHRVHAAELVLDDVLQICPTASRTARRACDVLRNWDRKVDLDSRGAQVFTEFWRQVRLANSNQFTGVVGNPDFWAVDFDPDHPLTTPRGIDRSKSENRALVQEALANAVRNLDAENVELDSAWGTVQFDARGETAIPIHGGDGNMGVYAAISAGLGEGGYTNIRSGNSYIQAVTWDDSDCPVADTILVPSQSSNPDSPHYRDQTALYSRKEWVRFPFCAEQIEAAQIGPTLILRSDDSEE